MDIFQHPPQTTHPRETTMSPIELLARDQAEETLRRAERKRLLRQLARGRDSSGQPAWSRRVRLKVGVALVGAGTAIAATADDGTAPKPLDRLA